MALRKPLTVVSVLVGFTQLCLTEWPQKVKILIDWEKSRESHSSPYFYDLKVKSLTFTFLGLGWNFLVKQGWWEQFLGFSRRLHLIWPSDLFIKPIPILHYWGFLIRVTVLDWRFQYSQCSTLSRTYGTLDSGALKNSNASPLTETA